MRRLLIRVLHARSGALRAVLKGNLARLDSTLAWDHDRAEDAF